MRKVKHHQKKICLLSVLLLVLQSCGFSSQRNSDIPRITAATPPQIFTDTADEPPPDYLLSPGDTLDIDIYRRSDLKSELSLKKVIVGPDGRVFVPLAGNILALNLTCAQLSSEISHAMSDYLVEPVVNVMLLEVKGNRVRVLGEVKTPGTYTIGAQTTALEGILLAGGFTKEADPSEIILVRTIPRAEEEPEEEPKEEPQDGQLAALNMQDLLDKADVRQNAVLRQGDIVLVPPNQATQRAQFSKTFDDIIKPFLSVATVISTIVILSGSSGSGS